MKHTAEAGLSQKQGNSVQGGEAWQDSPLLSRRCANIMCGISPRMPLIEIIRSVLNRLQETFPAFYAVYATLDEDYKLHLVAAACPQDMPPLEKQTFAVDQAAACLEALHQRRVVTMESAIEESGGNTLAAMLAETGCATLLSTSVCYADVRGVLMLLAPQSRVWTQLEKETLADVAEQTALQLQNAHAQAELRQAERALRKANKRTANILDSITDAFVSLDRNWQITCVNTRAEEMVQRSRQDMVGQGFWQLFPGAVEMRIHEELQRAMSRQVAVQFQDYYPTSCRWLEHHIHPSQDGVSIYSRDITAHKSAEEGLRQGLEKLQRSLNGIVQAMSLAVEIRDPYTAGHQRRVSTLAVRMAQCMGLTPQRVEGIRIAGLLHDMGKIAVPAEILSRPGRLTPAERSIIQMHPESGYNILKDIEFSAPVALVALQHHERLDGSGYPKGLYGEEIILEARIMAVADVVEAMSSHRPYRPAVGLEMALEEILRHNGTRYDTLAVEACLELCRVHAFDFEQVLAGVNEG